MENNNLIHNLERKDVTGMSYMSLFTFVALAVIIGSIFGYGFARFSRKSSTMTSGGGTGSATAKTAGVVDKKTFKDTAQGMLRAGGIDGEGDFHLERPGGASQNVYLTSTTVDLTGYIGKKITVWGQTFQGDKAGWLMDVGLVETQ